MSVTFHVPADVAAPFVFRLPGETKDRKLPNLQTLPIGIRARMDKASAPIQAAQKANKKPTQVQLATMGEAIIAMFDHVQPGLTDLISQEQMTALMAAWGEHSGIDAGESSASTGS